MELEATETIRKALRNIDDLKQEWERSWEDTERAILNKIEFTQIMIEKNQINRDLDLLLKEVDLRRNNMTLNFENIQRGLATFHNITENMDVNSLDCHTFIKIE